MRAIKISFSVAALSHYSLNNEMDDFSIKPGVPNAFGLLGGDANTVEARNVHWFDDSNHRAQDETLSDHR